MRKNKTKNQCEKYELAITNYVLGEAMGMTKEALFEHLKTCKNCRRDLTEWRDTYSVMKTEAYYQTPQGQAKMKRSFEDVKRQVAVATPAETRLPKPTRLPKRTRLTARQGGGQEGVVQVKPIPGEVILDPEEHIGHFAGVVWHHLARNGRVKEGELKRKVKLPARAFDRAIGWLAHEKKIHQARVKRTNYVYLTPLEREKYQVQV